MLLYGCIIQVVVVLVYISNYKYMNLCTDENANSNADIYVYVGERKIVTTPSYLPAII
jgi:hypothetical protein